MSVKRVVLSFSIVLCCVGMAVAQTEWVQYPDNPVFEDGYMNSVVFDGTTYHLWYTIFSDGGADIGHATSPDGIDWTTDPANPVVTTGDSGEWDDALLLAAAVTHDGDIFHMWYDGANSVDYREQTGYATSPDGVVWTKYPGNPVMEVGPSGSWDDTVAVPTTVILDSGTYRMWYMGFDAYWGPGTTSAIGYAESPDGINWTKNPEPVIEGSELPGSWDRGFVLDPYVFVQSGIYHMWFAGGADRFNWDTMNIGYAFSTDGTAWTKHRENPVLTMDDHQVSIANVRSDGSSLQMWYGYWDGEDNRIGHATSTCCPGDPALDHLTYIPAAAVAAGVQGAFFQTDVDLSNADDQSTYYEFWWLPRATDNTEEVQSETFNLGAGKSVRYSNILSEVFDLEPDSLGALAIASSSPGLLAMSRTYSLGTEETGGTFGQALPAIGTEEFIQHGEIRRILFGSENAEMRTNVGCQNGTDASTVVYLDLFKSDGTALEREMLILKPLGNEQVNRIFDGHNPVNGYVDVSLAQPGRNVYCYGSVLDNITNDPTTIPPQ